MSIRAKRFSLFLGLTAAVLLAMPAFPQGTLTGTISGQVVDPAGLALPGVTVTVSSPRLQGMRTVVSTNHGDYLFPALPSGEYTISFELAGFKPLKTTFDLKLSETKPFDVKLALATQTEEVTVTAEASGQFTQTGAVASTYNQDLLEKLPTARTPFAALLLAPGAHQTAVNNAVTISGAMSFENLFLVNGVAVQDNIRNTPLSLFIEDAVQETTVSTAAVSGGVRPFLGRRLQLGDQVRRQHVQRVVPHHLRQGHVATAHELPVQHPQPARVFVLRADRRGVAHHEHRAHLRGHPRRPHHQGQAVVLRRGPDAEQPDRAADHDHQRLPSPTSRTRSATRASSPTRSTPSTT